jgi:hypothetical protein
MGAQVLLCNLHDCAPVSNHPRVGGSVAMLGGRFLELPMRVYHFLEEFIGAGLDEILRQDVYETGKQQKRASEHVLTQWLSQLVSKS